MVYHQPSVNSRHSFPEKKCEIGEGKSKNIDIHFHYNTHRKVKLGISRLLFAFPSGSSIFQSLQNFIFCCMHSNYEYVNQYQPTKYVFILNNCIICRSIVPTPNDWRNLVAVNRGRNTTPPQFVYQFQLCFSKLLLVLSSPIYKSVQCSLCTKEDVKLKYIYIQITFVFSLCLFGQIRSELDKHKCLIWCIFFRIITFWNGRSTSEISSDWKTNLWRIGQSKLDKMSRS